MRLGVLGVSQFQQSIVREGTTGTCGATGGPAGSAGWEGFFFSAGTALPDRGCRSVVDDTSESH
jgi:hypothetical protein